MKKSVVGRCRKKGYNNETLLTFTRFPLWFDVGTKDITTRIFQMFQDFRIFRIFPVLAFVGLGML